MKRRQPTPRHHQPPEAIVIGVSAGGLRALRTIFTPLPAGFRLPIAIVQHQHPSSDDTLCRILGRAGRLRFRQAEDKCAFLPGTAYLAPPDYHLLIEPDRTLTLSIDEPVNFARPSIDVLFESAADVYGPGLVGVILTGANYDGSQGLRRIKERGGLTIIQDPATAEMPTMPLSAMQATPVDYILPLNQIGPFLWELQRPSGAPTL